MDLNMLGVPIHVGVGIDEFIEGLFNPIDAGGLILVRFAGNLLQLDTRQLG